MVVTVNVYMLQTDEDDHTFTVGYVMGSLDEVEAWMSKSPWRMYQRLEVHRNFTSFEEMVNNTARARALAKLTDEERVLLEL